MQSLVQANIPTRYGRFTVKAYESKFKYFPNLAFFTPGYDPNEVIDVRIHSECMTGDVFGSSRCDCGEQLDFSMKWIQKYGGILVYLRQEGRGIGLVNKLKAYNLQDEGLNTLEANHQLGFPGDLRGYEEAIHILRDLRVTRIRLLTNNPDKIRSFEKSGIEITGRIPVEIQPVSDNFEYLATKKQKMGHFISLSENIK